MDLLSRSLLRKGAVSVATKLAMTAASLALDHTHGATQHTLSVVPQHHILNHGTASVENAFGASTRVCSFGSHRKLMAGAQSLKDEIQDDIDFSNIKPKLKSRR